MSLANFQNIEFKDYQDFNTSRCMIRFPRGVLDSNAYLCDVGVYSAQVDGRNTGLYYPSRLGVDAIIEEMSLYAGSVELETITDHNILNALRNQLATNETSEDLNRFEKLNGNNVSVNWKGQWGYQPEVVDYQQAYTSPANGNLARERFHNQFQVPETATGGQTGLLSLKQCFNFLQGTDILPNIPDLQLRITWKTDGLLNDPNAPAAPGAPTYTPIPPRLIVSHLRNIKMPSSFQFSYLAYHQEAFDVPTAPADSIQKVSFTPKAFDGRLLQDVLVVYEPNSDKVWLKQQELSPAMVEEQLYFLVNGESLPGDPIDNPATKLRYLQQIYGSINAPYGAYVAGLVNGQGQILDDDDAVGTGAWSSYNALGSYAPGALKINQVIDKMRLQYQRKGSNLGFSDGATERNILTDFTLPGGNAVALVFTDPVPAEIAVGDNVTVAVTAGNINAGAGAVGDIVGGPEAITAISADRKTVTVATLGTGVTKGAAPVYTASQVSTPGAKLNEAGRLVLYGRCLESYQLINGESISTY